MNNKNIKIGSQINIINPDTNRNIKVIVKKKNIKTITVQRIGKNSDKIFKVTHNLILKPKKKIKKYKKKGGVLSLLQKSVILSHLNYTNNTDNNYFIQTVTPLLEGVTNKNQIKRVIKQLQRIPLGKLQDFITNILPLCEGINNGNQISRIIEPLIIIPIHELENIVEKALEEFYTSNGTMINIGKRIDVIKEAIKNFGGVGAAYLGANVHSKETEKEILNSINLLYKLNRRLTQQKIREGIDEFKQYIISKKRGKQREFILHALDYFDGSDIHLLGETINGSEIIARLWYFANSSNNTENALLSMMSGLMDSFNNPNIKHTVCPHGILIRLITAVLPGRLNGIKSKEINNNNQLTINNSMRYFIENPEIASLLERINSETNKSILRELINELVMKAGLFANENPKVNKQQFINMVKSGFNNNNNNNNN